MERPPISPGFNRVARTEELRPVAPGGRTEAAQIMQRADVIRERHTEHYQKHQQKFVNREFGTLLKRKKLILENTPPGTSRSLMEQAIANVQNRFEGRKQRINKAERTVLTNNMRQVHQNRIHELRLVQQEKLHGAQERLKKSRER